MLSDPQRQETRRSIKEAISRRDANAALQLGRTLLATGKPADVMFCASAFNELANELKESGAKRLKTCIVRSVTVEPILPSLTVEAVLSNYVLDLQVGGYGSYVDELLNPQSALAQFHPDVVLVLLDLEEIAGRLPDLCAAGKAAEVEQEIEQCVARVAQLLTTFRSASSARIVFQGCVVPDLTSLGDIGEANLPFSLTSAVQLLNHRLAVLCRTISDCIFFDVDHLAARHGRARWRDTRMFLASRLAVSARSLRHLCPRPHPLALRPLSSPAQSPLHRPRQHPLGRSPRRRRPGRNRHRQRLPRQLLPRVPALPQAALLARHPARHRLQKQRGRRPRSLPAPLSRPCADSRQLRRPQNQLGREIQGHPRTR